MHLEEKYLILRFLKSLPSLLDHRSLILTQTWYALKITLSYRINGFWKNFDYLSSEEIFWFRQSIYHSFMPD